VIWEVTRACDLACVHCRASADPVRHPLELVHRRGLPLLETIKEFGDPIMIFTGGDPLKRPDLFQLLAHKRGAGATHHHRFSESHSRCSTRRPSPDSSAPGGPHLG